METWFFVGFIAFVILLLSIDLGLFSRGQHEISVRNALVRTVIWVTVAFAFSIFVYFAYERHWFDIGKHPGQEQSGYDAWVKFITGYLVEESLSLDNIFVISLIITSFRIPSRYQHRVLYWGILGALVMRGIMIWLGTGLIRRFEWMTYVFGALLLVTAIRMLVVEEGEYDPEKAWTVRLARRFFPVTMVIDGPKFIVKVDGKRMVTPLLLAILVIESADVVFAVDSIPAIFAITHDPFIVFTSNVCAILGLRSLYFALAGLLDKFRYLKVTLVFLLAYIGIKMLVQHHYKIEPHFSLMVIAGMLSVGIAASVFAAHREKRKDLALSAAESELPPPTAQPPM